MKTKMYSEGRYKFASVLHYNFPYVYAHPRDVQREERCNKREKNLEVCVDRVVDAIFEPQTIQE